MPVSKSRRSESHGDLDRIDWSSRLNRSAFICLQVAIVWAPWPLGSYRPWALAVLATIVWIGLLAGLSARVVAAHSETAGAESEQGTAIGSRFRRTALIPLLALIGFAAIQVVQLVPGLGDGDGDGGGTISIDPFATRVYLLTTLLYLGAWSLVVLTVRTGERVSSLLATLVATGVLQAIAAVALYSTGAHYTLFFTAFDQGGRATATFPNPDHLAAYMEVTLAAALGWLLAQFGGGESSSAGGWRAIVVTVLTFVMSGKMLLRLLMVMMVIALVMTHSRMGNGAFFIGLSVVGTLIAIRSPRLRKTAIWLVLSMALIDMVVIGQWVGLDRLVTRLQSTAETTAVASGFGSPDAAPSQAYREESLQDRLRIPRLSLAVVADRPWLGHGGGTYVDAFPRFKPSGAGNLSMYWDHAHDDYVQVASDTGLIGLALWATVGIATLVRAIRLLGDSFGRQARGVGAAGAMALCCLGLHSLVDFGLHVPAIAISLTVVLAAVWSVPEKSLRRRRRREVGEGDSEDDA